MYLVETHTETDRFGIAVGRLGDPTTFHQGVAVLLSLDAAFGVRNSGLRERRSALGFRVKVDGSGVLASSSVSNERHSSTQPFSSTLSNGPS